MVRRGHDGSFARHLLVGPQAWHGRHGFLAAAARRTRRLRGARIRHLQPRSGARSHARGSRAARARRHRLERAGDATHKTGAPPALLSRYAALARARAVPEPTSPRTGAGRDIRDYRLRRSAIMALHFSVEEFAERRRRAIAAMAEAKLDGLLMFRQESMYYLTGYDTFGYVFFQCLYLGADGTLTLLTRAPDLLQAKHTSDIEDIRIWVDAPDAKPAEQ